MAWPQWGAGAQLPSLLGAVNSAPPVAAPMPPQGVGPLLAGQGAAPIMPAGYTPDQYQQLQQQNWQQWAQWQQQYQQWHQQYGEQYQKLAATGAVPPVTNVVGGGGAAGAPPMPAGAPPLPPSEANPPPPPPPDDHSQRGGAPFNQPPPDNSGPQRGQPFGGNTPQERNFGGNAPQGRGGQQFGNQQRGRGGQQQWQNQNNKRPFNQGSENDGAKRQMTSQGQWNAPNQGRGPVPNQPPTPQEKPSGPPVNHAKKLEELSEAENKFDKEFAAWESQFTTWKDQNANHPDKTQYREYEKKWESWRNSLLDRREQMRKKRVALQAAMDAANKASAPAQPPFAANRPPPLLSPAQQNKPPPLIPPAQQNKLPSIIPPAQLGKTPPLIPPAQQGRPPLPMGNQPLIPEKPIDILSKPPPTQNNEPLNFKPPKKYPGEEIIELDDGGNDFLKSSKNYDGIPGLDLEEGSDKPKNHEEEKPSDPEKGADLDAISKGINTILGDRKLLNMLSMVSQNQNFANSVVTNTTPRGPDPPLVAAAPTVIPSQYEHSSHSYDDYPDNRPIREDVHNFDDQTRMSFSNGPNDQDFGNANYGRGNQFGNRGPNDNFGNRGPNDNFGNRGGPSDNFGNRGGPNDNFGNRGGPNDNFGNRGGPNDNFGNRGGPNNFGNRGSNDNFGNKGGPNDNFGNRGPNANFGNRGPKDSFGNRGPNDNFGKFGGHPPNNQFDRFGKNFAEDSLDDGPPPHNRFDKMGRDNRPPNNNRDLNRFDNDNFGRGGGKFNKRGDNRSGGRNNDRFNKKGGGYDDYDDYGYEDDRYHDSYAEEWNEEDDYEQLHNRFNQDDEMGHDRHQQPHGNQQHPPNKPSFRDQPPPSFQGQQPPPPQHAGHNKQPKGIPSLLKMPMMDRPPVVEPPPMVFEPPPSAEPPIVQPPVVPPPAESLQIIPPDDIAPPPPPAEEELFVPEVVVDYEHKPIKPPEPEVSLEPIYTFDYRQKPVSRIPYPQRPKWLYETVKNIRQFDPLGTTRFGFEPPVSERYERDISRLPPYDRPPIERINPYDRPPIERDLERGRYPPERNHFDRRPDNDRFERRPEPDRFERRPEPERFERRPENDRFERRPENDRFERRPEPDRFERRPENGRFERRRSFERDLDRGKSRERHDRDRFDRDRFDDRRRDRDRFDRERRRSRDRDRRSPPDRRLKRDVPPKREDFEELSDGDFEDDNKGQPKSGGLRFSPPPLELERISPEVNLGANPSNPVTQRKEQLTLDDIIYPPGRFNRPPRIVIIIRGPPGSGKTYLAKLIKDKEVENGGSAPRILSLDDYFMVEQEKQIMEDGVMVKVKQMHYEYEAEMEDSYRQSLTKAFKKTVIDGYFPFIVVDNINDKVRYFGEMWSFAKQNGFQVYICQMDLDPEQCARRNVHNRTRRDIEDCIAAWEPTPAHHPTLDATNFLQNAIPIDEVEMEIVEPSGDDSGRDEPMERDLMASTNPSNPQEPWKNTSSWTSGRNQPNPSNQARNEFGGPTWRNRNNKRR